MGNKVVVAAPSSHANDGLHTIRYYSIDNAGNVEVGHRVCSVDGRPPGLLGGRRHQVAGGTLPVRAIAQAEVVVEVAPGSILWG